MILKISLREVFLLHCLFLGSLLMSGCETVAYQAETGTIKKSFLSDFEARQKIISSLHSAALDIDHTALTNISADKVGFKFTTNNREYVLKFADLKDKDLTVLSVAKRYAIQLNPNWYISWLSFDDAKRFVDAVEAMRYYGSGEYVQDDAQDLVVFKEKAKSWAQQFPKPVLGEEVHKFRVLADDALEEKQFEKAAVYYEQGLAADPMWPVGQYNAAMIYAELKNYTMAISHMERYLALKPDAKDARECQDRIYVWQEKAK